MGNSTSPPTLESKLSQPFHLLCNLTVATLQATELTVIPVLLLALSSWFLVGSLKSSFVRDPFGGKAPYVGPSRQWLPSTFKRLLFHANADRIIFGGYQKFKNSIFRIMRNDYDLVVLSTKYVDELRILPETKVSSIEAHIMNLVGKYSTTDILLESPLHTLTLQKRLTPNLGLLMPIVMDELDKAFELEFPKLIDNSATVPAFHTILRIIARMSARVFVGSPLCRDEKWLNTTINYTESLFMTVFLLKLVPPFLHPVISLMLPCYWRVHQHLRYAKRTIGPIVKTRRREAAENPNWEEEKPFDFLQWMMEEAGDDPREQDPHKLAHRQLLISLASIHTTTMCTVHVLYDLAMYPEYFKPLREEVQGAVQSEGGWTKNTISKLKLMDSVIKESQRINPPSLLAFHRVVLEPLTLSDGTYLPERTQICMPSGPLSMDPAVVLGSKPPETFDGYRWYNARLREGEGHLHQLTMAGKDHLHFGIGRYACPGRFLAAHEAKVVLGKLLLEYEWEIADGKERPRNWTMEEKITPNMTAKLVFRKINQ